MAAPPKSPQKVVPVQKHSIRERERKKEGRRVVRLPDELVNDDSIIPDAWKRAKGLPLWWND